MIREADRSDRERIEELYKLLIPNDSEINVLDDQIAYIKQDPNNFLFVSEIEGRVAGTVLLSFSPDPMYGNRPYAVAENIIVDPEYRGKGIGKKLIAHIESYCTKRNCREILLMSHLRRTEAHVFFESQGFNHVGKGFKKYLD